MKPFETLMHGGQVRRLKRLALAALAEYDIDVARLKLLVHGENTTFRVWEADGSKYVLRITRPGKQEVPGVRSEMQWLDALRRETSLTVPSPLFTRDGDLLTIKQVVGVPEPRICVLFRWVEGRMVNDRLTPTHLHQVGVFTAQLHDHVSQWALPEGFQRGTITDLSDAAVAKMVGAIALVRPAEDVHVIEIVIERIRAVLDAIGQGADRYGLMHADLHQWNYLFDQGNVRAIDFDDCGFGPFLYDLSVTLFNVQDKPRYDALWTALFAGYRSVRPMPKEFEGYIDTFFQLRRLQLMTWEIEMRNHPAFAEWETWVGEHMVLLNAFVETS